MQRYEHVRLRIFPMISVTPVCTVGRGDVRKQCNEENDNEFH